MALEEEYCHIHNPKYFSLEDSIVHPVEEYEWLSSRNPTILLDLTISFSIFIFFMYLPIVYTEYWREHPCIRNMTHIQLKVNSIYIIRYFEFDETRYFARFVNLFWLLSWSINDFLYDSKVARLKFSMFHCETDVIKNRHKLINLRTIFVWNKGLIQSFRNLIQKFYNLIQDLHVTGKWISLQRKTKFQWKKNFFS